MSHRPHKKWPGWWVIDYYPEGRKGKKVVINFEGSKDEAEAYERELRGKHISTCKTTINPPFKDIASEFVTWATTNRSANYVKSIGWSLKNLLPAFGKLPPSRITDTLIEQYKSGRKDTPRACNQELEMLTIIINWGADQKRGYCQKLPFKPEKLKVFRNLPQPPAPGEFDALLQAVRDNFKQARQTPEQQTHKIAMLLIMYECGLRWIECRNLKWENIRQTDGRVYLGRTKANVARYTFLPPSVIGMLKPYWKTTGHIFINPRTDKPYTTIYKSLHQTAKNAGISLKGAHTLRHALGTDIMDASDDIRGVQQALGHADIKTSTLYEHTATDRLKRLLEGVRKHRGNTSDFYVETQEPDYCI